MEKTGILYICPTPIGNLEDITYRTIRILNEVDLIAAEDTRHTLKLLNHFEIKKPLISYHEHNKMGKGPVLIDKLNQGQSIALVSDAGMPGISDPGEDIIKLAIEEGIDVVGLPGPSASILALVISGLPTKRFVFEGFLPAKKKDKEAKWVELQSETRTIIMYESPHHLKKYLKELENHLGNRKIALCRELTKTYEEIFRGTVETAIAYYEEHDPRGEYVIIIEGGQVQAAQEMDFEERTIPEWVTYFMAEGLDKKEAVKKTAKQLGLSKNEVYMETLDM